MKFQISIGLMVVNVICIFLTAFLVLKVRIALVNVFFTTFTSCQIKEVTPMKSLSSPLARFWKEDIKIARDYAFTHDPEQSLGEDFIREWVVSCAEVKSVCRNQRLKYATHTGTDRFE
jgi:hypothetical protein